MKMGIGTRIVFTIFLLIVMALCVAIILASFGGFARADLVALLNGFLDTGYKYIWAGAALLLFVTAACLMFFGIRGNGGEEKAVILETGLEGSVSITLDALKELAARYLKDVSGIITTGIDVKVVGERNVRLKLELSARPELEIPAATRQINTEIKDYVSKYSGIEISHVEIAMQPLKQNQIV